MKFGMISPSCSSMRQSRSQHKCIPGYIKKEMSTPQPPAPAKLVIGIILRERKLQESILHSFKDRFGPLDMVSRWLAFDFTHYYEKEMGPNLERRLFSFKRLIRQDDLPDIKRFTNEVENRYCEDDKRKVNIDPGYLLLERFVLATGKNFPHRIYIGKDIYADLTLIYAKGGFQSLPWTYPDYARGNIQQFLLKVREKYKLDMAKC
jgi:hypothetical protein